MPPWRPSPRRPASASAPSTATSPPGSTSSRRSTRRTSKSSGRTAQRVVTELEPAAAVEAFFDAFVRYAQTKQALLTELRQAFEKKPGFRSQARELIESSFNLVIDQAKEAGVVRPDIDGADVMQLVTPVCTNASISAEQTARLLGMILDGMRADAASYRTRLRDPAVFRRVQ